MRFDKLSPPPGMVNAWETQRKTVLQPCLTCVASSQLGNYLAPCLSAQPVSAAACTYHRLARHEADGHSVCGAATSATQTPWICRRKVTELGSLLACVSGDKALCSSQSVQAPFV